METQDQNSKKRSGMIWIILLIVSLILNIYQWQSRTTIVNTMEQQVQNLSTAGDSVKNVLAQTRSDLEHFRGLNAHVDSLLNQADSDLVVKEGKLKTALGQKKNLEKQAAELKSQLKDLQSFRDDYMRKVDSLLTVNKQLTADKEQLTGKVETISKDLEILENKITKSGDKNVYLKITEPGGKQLGDRSKGSGDMKVEGSGEMVLYAATTTINYTNARQNVCLSWEEQKDKMYSPGKYLIEIYIDGILAGASSYTLK